LAVVAGRVAVERVDGGWVSDAAGRKAPHLEHLVQFHQAAARAVLRGDLARRMARAAGEALGLRPTA
jgi:hypothetical protein